MRDVLVHATNFKSWSGVVEYAADLAARLDGALTGVYVYPSPVYMMPPYGSPDLLSVIVENAQKIEEAAHASEANFVAWAKSIGVHQAAWQVAEGSVPETLAHIGNWHDVLVLERNPNQPWGLPADLGTLVLGAGIPCIVTSASMREAPLSCIALAWNGTAESVRAIHAALPLIHHAARVVLLKGAKREDYIEMNWRPPFDIDLYLARHGIKVEHLAISAPDSDAGEALLAAAANVKADLLVMGAYGRNRFSEWIFGGATRKVLSDATLPVFFRN